MRKLRKISIVIIILILALFTAKQIFPILKLDGYSGLALSILNAEDTKYSVNYSSKKFLKIKNGMTKQEVIDILGDPITEWVPEDNINGLQYSESPKSTHYRLRQIYLKDNKVIDRISYYYID